MKKRLQQRKDLERRKPNPLNRVGSIKERAESLRDVSIDVTTDANKVYIGPKLVATWHDADSLERLEQLLTEDTMYLLQRLERYETALQGIVEKQGNIRPDGEAWEYVGEFNESVKIAKEALKE